MKTKNCSMMYWGSGLSGLSLGIFLHRTGFSSYGPLRKMFLLREFRLIGVFAVGLVLASLGFYFFSDKEALPEKIFHKGSIPGGIIFGLGWFMTGACPAVPVVQLGEGKGLAFLTLSGVLFGTVLYKKVHEKYFRWDKGSCEA